MLFQFKLLGCSFFGNILGSAVAGVTGIKKKNAGRIKNLILKVTGSL
tara:strand:+ start:861 stop:1001 length:141 start_codon:yes stop_codon:yes gene_type:complete